MILIYWYNSIDVYYDKFSLAVAGTYYAIANHPQGKWECNESVWIVPGTLDEYE